MKKYITFADLDNMNDEDEVLVCRIDLFNKISRLRVTGGIESEKLSILESARQRLNGKDFKDFGEDGKFHYSFGVEMTVKDIKTVFTAEDFENRRVSLRLIDSYEKIENNGTSV